MTALLILISLCVLAVSFIVWLVFKLREGDEPEIETEHDWDAAQFWERK
jgi:hypothetical protein